MAILFLSLLLFCSIDYVSAIPESSQSPSSVSRRLVELFTALFQSSGAAFSTWDMVKIAALCGLVPGAWFVGRHFNRKASEVTSWQSTAELRPGTAVKQDDGKIIASSEAAGTDQFQEEEAVDPGLLKKHSETKSYTTSRYTYKALRIFYRRHPQADKLPTTPAPLPLLVFIHGLGGSVAQFHPLLTSLVNLSSCLAIDLPGCGLSEYSETSWDAYKTDALVELLATVIEDYRDRDKGQGVVLIGHSMGCSLASLLSSRVSTPDPVLTDNIVGLVAICPKAEPPEERDVANFNRLLSVPGPIFDLWRAWDRRGGANSASVKRFVGSGADLDTRKLQVRFNQQSRTPVWRRMAAGTLPSFQNGVPKGGLPGKDVWAGLRIPVYLIAGEADHITKPEELTKIASFLGRSHPVQLEAEDKNEAIADSAAPVDVSPVSKSDQATLQGEDRASLSQLSTDLPADAEAVYDDPSTPHEELADIPPQPKHPRMVLKTTVLPSPANHAMLYMPATVRILAGLIGDFLETQVSPRLSLGWQLQFLATAGKWDVKNLAKWQAVKPVSDPIAGIFRAMKTLREVDEVHCPEVFVQNWGEEIKDIIDISHESPVYDPRGLENGGIRYHKLPTVSKIPPTGGEVKEFIALVDRLREEQTTRREKEQWIRDPFVGVHCHYGFNRTGYFIVCYLIERCGYTVQEALDEFATKRPKGIKHAHFMDQLFVRYCVGLQRSDLM